MLESPDARDLKAMLCPVPLDRALVEQSCPWLSMPLVFPNLPNDNPLEGMAPSAQSRPSTPSTVDHSSDDWDDSADIGGDEKNGGGGRPKTAMERAKAKRRRDELTHGKGRRTGTATSNERSSSAPPRRLPAGGGKSNKVGGGWARRIFSDEDEDSSSTEEETSSEEEVCVMHTDYDVRQKLATNDGLERYNSRQRLMA